MTYSMRSTPKEATSCCVTSFLLPRLCKEL
jgi:hypothetical protein